MNLRPVRLLPVILAAALAGTLVPTNVASAAPVDDKRAQAAQLQSQIDANGRKIDALSEEANGARYRREQAQAARDDAQNRIDAAQAERGRLRSLLGKRALDVYKGAGTSSPLDAIEVGDAREFAARSKYAAAASNTQSKLVSQLRSAEEELATRQVEYDTAIEQAKAEQDRIEASRSEIESANARQAQLLNRVQGELATLVQQEQQRREAEAAARARALTAPRPAATSRSSSQSGSPSSGRANTSSDGGGGNWSGPSASGGAGAAIAFARSQLGKPYAYAASGPDAYDCSGLTMRAWQAGGVSMPHYSGAQYDMFPHVPLDALQPGDLVFWGPGGSNHVAMYTGGGSVIYAPQTGSFVKEGPIYGSPVGAARPG
jgi:cell wall-associated NlpC family hydrolase